MGVLFRAPTLVIFFVILTVAIGGCSAVLGLDFTKDDCAFGCDGGSDGGADATPTDGRARADGNPGGTSFSLGGTVSGLVGTGHALSDGTDTLAVTATGAFTF